jgi:PAS domain S-box-containing protein
MDKALKESEERYHKLIDFLPDAIYVSHNGINVFSNPAGLTLIGSNNYDELSGKEILQYIKFDSSDLENEKMKSMLLNNEAMPLHEYKIIRKDGTEINAESSSISFPWEGETALLIAVRDITERKQAEELERKLDENNILLRETMELDVLKTEFFANVSHELKTPLNVVLSSAQMIEGINNGSIKFNNNAKADKYISMMKKNCFRLIRLVDNLIDSTKIDAGYFQPYLKNLDIVSVVEDITLSVAKYIEDKGINLLFDTEVEEKIIACDGEKIERIILNLLSNAAKFTNDVEVLWLAFMIILIALLYLLRIQELAFQGTSRNLYLKDLFRWINP